MFKNLSKQLQLYARNAGITIARRNSYTDPFLRLVAMLDHHEIEAVLDVGANEGQFAKHLIAGGFKGTIYSIEPLLDLNSKLRQMAPSVSQNWVIVAPCAISDKEGKAHFNVTTQSASSSLLTPAPRTSLMPEIFTVQQTIEVPTKTIADICHEFGILDQKIFLKLDIQGAEKLALTGAEPIMASIRGMIVEMPICEYYIGQDLWQALDAWISAFGFAIWDIEQVWREPKTGKLDYIDITYFRVS